MSYQLTDEITCLAIVTTVVNAIDEPWLKPRYAHFQCVALVGHPDWSTWIAYAMDNTHPDLTNGTCELCGKEFIIKGRTPSIHFI